MASLSGRGKTTAQVMLGAVLVAAVLVLVNVISAGTFVRLDLTEGREFTVSAGTKDILRNLKDLATITVYMTEDLPPQLATLRRQISDILDEYRNYGRGRVQIDFVDPSKDPAIEERLRTLGIPQITAQTLARDQFQAVNVYLGMLITYLDKQETIPIVQDTYTLEYDLTSRLLKVSRDRDYVVGVLSGPAEHDLNKGLNSLKTLIEDQFRVRSVSLRDGEIEVPAETDLLIVAGPSRVSEGVKYRLDQYLMRGGKIIYLIDEVRLPQDGGLQALPLSSGIEDLLAHYGVRIQKALILDRLCEAATFTSGFMRYTLPYPYWPKAVPDLLNSRNAITQRLESLTLPWVAPLEVDLPIAPGDPLERVREIEKEDREARRAMAEKMGAPVPDEESPAEPGVEAASAAAASADGTRPLASVLARSSPQAWTISGRYDLNPQQRFAPMGGTTESEIMAVALQGRFTSFYRDREVPPLGPPQAESPDKEGAGESSAAAVDPAVAAAAREVPIPESPETEILVVGNAQFITDSFLGQFPANAIFIMNAIDWMTLGDQLISIRSRGATDRPLKPLSDTAKSLVKLLCIAGTPLLVVVLGLVRLTIRRRASSAQEVAAREA